MLILATLGGCYMLEHENRAVDMHVHHYNDFIASDTLQVFRCKVPGCNHTDTLRRVAGRWAHRFQ
jgi:hypothetical protein